MNTMETCFESRYQRIGILRKHGLIDVYKGIDIQTGEEVEIEQIRTVHLEFEHEARVYRDLAGCIGIPSVYWCGIDGDHYVLVHEVLGPSLAELFQFCKCRFSLKTVAILAWQLITRLETIHERGIVHGNINLDNVRMGIGKRSRQVHVVNFEHAQRYKYLSYSHLPLVEKSVCEDIESLGYTVFALFDGVPREFTLYLLYSNWLEINQKPNYSYLRQLIRGLLTRKSIQLDFCFDWMSQEQQLPQFDGILTKLVTEEKCLDIQRQQNSTNEALSDEQVRQFFTLHEALLNGYCDLFAAYNHPSSSATVREDEYGMPSRLWNHGIYTFLEMLQKGLPDNMRRFLRVSYVMVAVLMETVPIFENIWIMYLRRLAGYRMDVERANNGDWEVWCDVVELWNEKANMN